MSAHVHYYRLFYVRRVDVLQGNSALHYLISQSNFPGVEVLLDSNYCNVNIQNAVSSLLYVM